MSYIYFSYCSAGSIMHSCQVVKKRLQFAAVHETTVPIGPDKILWWIAAIKGVEDYE